MSEKKPTSIKRDPDRGKLGGVCAGIANYWGWELWLVRIIAISGLFLSGSLFFWGYIALWIVLDKQAPAKDWQSQVTAQPVHFEIKSQVWKAGQPPRRAFQDIKATFDNLETRLQKLESYVTSKQFSIAREINKL
ncbi:envelope stress response membrane protein PspC [Saccharobesus litoralis]|uniref:Envelope stress response membrane protein PspC n=1 Tax=Saccharobesus litoralis TaxID=2172099 RepID=A0A2S0VSA4_9ALTE|nr:envelope stress response membrane protein PspC [Saccharobesus litoralis]AWB67101.1 envelope stress response membrane protein PspC [Saccharobesus litoralis]